MRETDKQLNKKEHCSHMCLRLLPPLHLILLLLLSFLLSATWCGSHKPQPQLRLQVESIPEPRLIIGLRGFCAGLITKRVTRAWIIQGYLRYVCPSLPLCLSPSPCPSLCAFLLPAAQLRIHKLQLQFFLFYYSIKSLSLDIEKSSNPNIIYASPCR